jgi:DNA topoisomerase-2
MATETYRKLSHREHVLARPGMYLGSVEEQTCPAWVMADGGVRMCLRDCRYVPALYKIFDEILVNAIDHSTRLRRLRATDASVVPVKRISVSLERATGVIEVSNDGDGISTETQDDGLHIPELVFAHLLTSSNFDDDAERTIGGQNGIGAKACNIFSRFFEVETVDRRRKVVYTQRYEDNMSVVHPPVLAAAAASRKPGTTVRFLPDYARFGMSDGLSEDMRALMVRRVHDATAVTDPEVAVFLDGEKLAAKSFERYVDLYLGDRGEQGRVYERVADGWELAAALSDGAGLQQVSFVNGVATLRGGKHVDHVVQQLCRKLADLITSRKKEATVRPQFIRDNLFVFLRATVPNPAFDSQSKETLTTPVSKFGVKIEVRAPPSPPPPPSPLLPSSSVRPCRCLNPQRPPHKTSRCRTASRRSWQSWTAWWTAWWASATRRPAARSPRPTAPSAAPFMACRSSTTPSGREPPRAASARSSSRRAIPPRRRRWRGWRSSVAKSTARTRCAAR